MTKVEERISDLVATDIDGLICRDCSLRKPDTVFKSGRVTNNGDNVTCQMFGEKPMEYMQGKCPYYKKG